MNVFHSSQSNVARADWAKKENVQKDGQRKRRQVRLLRDPWTTVMHLTCIQREGGSQSIIVCSSKGGGCLLF